MPRISDIQMLRLPKQPVLCIRCQTVPEALPEVIGKGYEKLAAHLEKIGGHLADIPFVTYCQDLSPEAQPAGDECCTSFIVELCFPLAAPLPGEGEIAFKALPARDVAVCMVLGPYDAIGPVYEEMAAWIQEKGYTIPRQSSECYYNGQGYPKEQLLTKLMMPLERQEEK